MLIIFKFHVRLHYYISIKFFMHTLCSHIYSLVCWVGGLEWYFIKLIYCVNLCCCRPQVVPIQTGSEATSRWVIALNGSSAGDKQGQNGCVHCPVICPVIWPVTSPVICPVICPWTSPLTSSVQISGQSGRCTYLFYITHTVSHNIVKL